jgi:hypothetical protein
MRRRPNVAANESETTAVVLAAESRPLAVSHPCRADLPTFIVSA